MLRMIVVGCAAALLAGCAPTPQAQGQPAQQPVQKAPCNAGADAKGIAEGFFSFFKDDLNGCL